MARICLDGGIVINTKKTIKLRFSKQSPSLATLDSVSAAASVGAIGLRPMVATGNPHPLGKGALKGGKEAFGYLSLP